MKATLTKASSCVPVSVEGRPSTRTACSQEHEAASLCPDLQGGREFRGATVRLEEPGRKNHQKQSDGVNTSDPMCDGKRWP